MQHVKQARERALSAEESDNSDADDHIDDAELQDGAKVSLLLSVCHQDKHCCNASCLSVCLCVCLSVCVSVLSKLCLYTVVMYLTVTLSVSLLLTRAVPNTVISLFGRIPNI